MAERALDKIGLYRGDPGVVLHDAHANGDVLGPVDAVFLARHVPSIRADATGSAGRRKA
jgi:hypothetical protein